MKYADVALSADGDKLAAVEDSPSFVLTVWDLTTPSPSLLAKVYIYICITSTFDRSHVILLDLIFALLHTVVPILLVCGAIADELPTFLQQ